MMDERAYLRDLAKRQRELAELPIMRQREQMWYDHNEAAGARPMISVEEGHYWKEMAPEMHCTDPLNREMEYQLLHQIQKVPSAPGEPAEGFNHYRVALPDELQHFLQLRPFCSPLSAGLVDEDLFHFQLLHDDLLSDRVLIICGSSHIPNFHGCCSPLFIIFRVYPNAQ